MDPYELMLAMLKDQTGATAAQYGGMLDGMGLDAASVMNQVAGGGAFGGMQGDPSMMGGAGEDQLGGLVAGGQNPARFNAAPGALVPAPVPQEQFGPAEPLGPPSSLMAEPQPGMVMGPQFGPPVPSALVGGSAPAAQSDPNAAIRQQLAAGSGMKGINPTAPDGRPQFGPAQPPKLPDTKAIKPGMPEAIKMLMAALLQKQSIGALSLGRRS